MGTGVFVWLCFISNIWGFPGGTVVKNPMQDTQEMWVQSWDQKDPLEEEMATHSSILAWEIQWSEKPGLQPWGCKRVRCDLMTKQLWYSSWHIYVRRFFSVCTFVCVCMHSLIFFSWDSIPKGRLLNQRVWLFLWF